MNIYKERAADLVSKLLEDMTNEEAELVLLYAVSHIRRITIDPEWPDPEWP